MGASAEARGAKGVASFFAGRAQAARLALVDGIPAAVWAPGGRPQVVCSFAVSDGKITAIALTANPDQIRDRDIVFISSRGHRPKAGVRHRRARDDEPRAQAAGPSSAIVHDGR